MLITQRSDVKKSLSVWLTDTDFQQSNERRMMSENDRLTFALVKTGRPRDKAALLLFSFLSRSVGKKRVKEKHL